MHTTCLRKVGGSVMLAVPPAILEMLHLHAGTKVGVAIDDGRLVIEPQRHRYTLKELLDQCDSKAKISEEDKQWLEAKPVGGELL
jgi:antitoxin ChpS